MRLKHAMMSLPQNDVITDQVAYRTLLMLYLFLFVIQTNFTKKVFEKIWKTLANAHDYIIYIAIINTIKLHFVIICFTHFLVVNFLDKYHNLILTISPF